MFQVYDFWIFLDRKPKDAVFIDIYGSFNIMDRDFIVRSEFRLFSRDVLNREFSNCGALRIFNFEKKVFQK